MKYITLPIVLMVIGILQEPAPNRIEESKIIVLADTLNAIPVESTIAWKGTKMRGLGKHEGEVGLQNGMFFTNGTVITGGFFSVNMEAITVTDIPEHEIVPRRRLINHLKSEDFFNTVAYPKASLKINSATHHGSGNYSFRGDLTMRGVTESVEFDGYFNGNTFTTNFEIDRFKWDVAYSGSWVDRTFVDRDIQLSIEIALSN